MRFTELFRSGISVEFPAVKMTVSCLATDGRHLGSGLVTRQIRKSEPKILFCLPQVVNNTA